MTDEEFEAECAAAYNRFIEAFLGPLLYKLVEKTNEVLKGDNE